MISLLDCYNNDTEGIGINTSFKLHAKEIHGGPDNVEILFRISVPSFSNQTLYYAFIPPCKYPTEVSYQVLLDYKKYRQKMGISEFRTTDMYGGTYKMGIDIPPVHDIIYIYVNCPFDQSGLKVPNPLDDFAKEKNITVYFRGEEYRKEREKHMKYLAFISHDSRDKELIAKPLAEKLRSKYYSVWYDEYTLEIGDNLRESIEKGIKDTKKCILIITPNFVSNPGWTKKEFNAIFSKEIVEKKNVMLPIWYNITAEEVYNYSPNLHGIYALQWPKKEDCPKEIYEQEVNIIIDKIVKKLDKE